VKKVIKANKDQLVRRDQEGLMDMQDLKDLKDQMEREEIRVNKDQKDLMEM
jgi:hypothetical protein